MSRAIIGAAEYSEDKKNAKKRIEELDLEIELRTNYDQINEYQHLLDERDKLKEKYDLK